MPTIAFIDSEVNPKTDTISDLGAILGTGAVFHKSSLQDFFKFIENADFVCGHNILNHDLKYIGIRDKVFIDTLFWSPLLFPRKPYHNLLKDDKLLSDELNNPLSDAVKAKDLFYEEYAAFEKLDRVLKNVFYFLLHNRPEFNGLFKFMGKEGGFNAADNFLIQSIHTFEICQNAPLRELIREYPIELAYCLALINVNDSSSITPPWVLNNFPRTQIVMKILRNTPCKNMCEYCSQKLDAGRALKHFFGFDNFREYAGEPLQEYAVNAAIYEKSILVIFPTGGGKSKTFQLPALISGENERGLTVVISPLQSLMKDQVDNLERDGITRAVMINGMLEPIERAKAIERVADGSIDLLYIAPESLRSNTIEHLLMQRNVVRFVIDEAHCFSAWGQDFRPDYLYIASFIKKLQEKKNCEKIPVSCFTATAKQNVIEDICAYFNKNLGLDLEVIKAKSYRTNLSYKIFEREAEDKYVELRNIITEKNCPTIVYVSRTKTAEDLAERLCNDGLNAKPFHGQMDKDIKILNQNEFMQGNVQIVVATSAFGMGVDKKDVGLVVHYDISDSLENYLQEAGRAGRDENIKADCYVLFNEDDLDKHFLMLNATKLNIKEINQVWRAIKLLSKIRPKFQKSALEIAREAGWDVSKPDIDTRVITAINALEQSNYVKRENNYPRVFANSIMQKTMQEVSLKIDSSQKFIDDKQKMTAKRIMTSLFSSKAGQRTKDHAEERIDHIADILGLDIKEVIEIINILRDERILADAKDLVAFIDNKKANKILDEFIELERFLIGKIDVREKVLHIKKLNSEINSSPEKIKRILNYLAIFHSIKRHTSGDNIHICSLKELRELERDLTDRYMVSNFIITFLNEKIENNSVSFSVLELKDAFNAENSLFKKEVTIKDIEDALYYLSKIGALNIEGGFFVIYNRLTIEKLEYNPKIQYKEEDYKNLSQFYENRTMQIHIVGEYAKKMLHSESAALDFANDYFNLNYSSFLSKYFNKSEIKNIKRNISVKKYKKLFEELSDIQREIVDNKDADCIVVAAGPGSGKTKTLVHKLASLLLMEEVKPEQLLMLTFSRAAATEFKRRLIDLIGKTAHFVEIKTFHSYCFDLLGKMGSLEDSENVIRNAVEKIKCGEIEQNRITKTCLVIDEAQDMSEAEFEMVKTLKEMNDDMRLIAVGDDDQNIYEFRGSNSAYFASLLKSENCVKYELLKNYRSKPNIIDLANDFVKNINNRMKSNIIKAVQKENGRIKVVKYQSEHIVCGLVNDVLSTSLTGSTCVLAQTNDEVLLIAGMLSRNNRTVKIIQSNTGFNLQDISEVRYFMKSLGSSILILDETWREAKQKLKAKFKNTNGLEVAENIIREFEQATQKKYKTDFEVFVSESKLEDFAGENASDTIFVSTMHKAKGKEFDNVFIMLNSFMGDTDEKKRLLYVAMTRAKSLLHIHKYNSISFNSSLAEVRQDAQNYPPVNKIPMLLTHRDVNLGSFKYKQKEIDSLNGNENLRIDDLFKFSKSFKEKVEERKKRGFEIKEMGINFIVFWKGEDMEKEIKIILPKVVFER